jgi:hypothetical protein
MRLAPTGLRVSSLLAVRVTFAFHPGDSVERPDAESLPTVNDVVEAFELLTQVYALAGQSSNPSDILFEDPTVPGLERHLQLQLHRLSMESPLDFLASIPPAFLAIAGTGGLLAFLTSFERVFNIPLAIRVDRKRLEAESQTYEAEQAEQAFRLRAYEQKLAWLDHHAAVLRLTPKDAELVELDDAGSPIFRDVVAMPEQAEENPRLNLLRAIRSGEATMSTVLLRPPEYSYEIGILELLMAVPGLGRVKANQILASSQLSPSARLGELPESKRRDLAVRLLDVS